MGLNTIKRERNEQDEIIDYCLSKKGAYIDFPFGETPLCIKVAKKLFAQVYQKDGDSKVTLNCDVMTGEIYRNQYPGTVVRGYHCPPKLQPFFNTIYLNGVVAEEELKILIDHAYSVVVGKLPKRTREELSGNIEG